MKTMIPSETVVLHERTYAGEDDFGHETWTETDVSVAGVIIGEPSTTDIESSMQVYGKRLAYMLGIPKGDTHNWTDATVTVRGMTFHTIGIPLQFSNGAMPNWWKWDKKIGIELYD